LLPRENPPSNVHIPISNLTDVLIVNRRHDSTFHSFGGSHTYGGGFSGPRMYVGGSTSNTIGTIQMDIGDRYVMEWRGLSDPQGIKNILILT
jgi:hypothetical protein